VSLVFRICSKYKSDRKIGKWSLVGVTVGQKKPNSQVIKNQYRHRDALLQVSELYIYSPNNSDFNSKREMIVLF
jgi:hypothetical protein